MSKRRFMGQFLRWLAAGLAGYALATAPVRAEDLAPDAMILKVSNEVLDTIKSDAAIRGGDVGRLMTLVDNKVMPNVNFQRMTAAAVGPGWRQATPEQRQRLQGEFKALLVRTYAGALSQVNDMSVALKPLRAGADDKDVTVRTEVKGKSQPDPVQLDYRLEKAPGEGLGWKIYNLNVMGVWLVDTYRTQFAQEVNAHGIDGLINLLVERNKAAAGKKG